jgi:hypothetical protein
MKSSGRVLPAEEMDDDIPRPIKREAVFEMLDRLVFGKMTGLFCRFFVSGSFILQPAGRYKICLLYYTGQWERFFKFSYRQLPLFNVC